MNVAMSCPVCAGPIGAHLVRPEFTCHHCTWALKANVGSASKRAVVVSVVAALAALASALLLLFPHLAALSAGCELGALVGFAIGAVTYRASLVLTPLRPQRAPAGAERYHALGPSP